MDHAPTRPWHATAIDEACRALDTSTDGLDAATAAARLAQIGPNVLSLAPPIAAWRVLLAQFRSVVVLLLAAAAAVAWLTSDALDALAIGAVLVVNAAIGFVTEIRARRAIESLTTLTPRRAFVMRPGLHTPAEIGADTLVPGDVIVVEAGSAVPADARVIRDAGLRVNESLLTGESVPVDKTSAVVPAETGLADRTNMIYTGTTVADGRAFAVVVATAMSTEIGRIGGLVSHIKEGRTPLEDRLDALGRTLVWLALCVAAVVAVLGWSQGLPWSIVLAASLALAVAAVPEGLPAVATIALAVGVRRMARRRALVRRLPAVESLGSVTVVCTDKTGTLTAGEMVATRLWAGGYQYEITGSGYAPTGTVTPAPAPGAVRAIEAAVLASRGEPVQENDHWVAHGDPTDVALLVLGHKLEIHRATLVHQQPEVGEVPFSSALRLTATFHREHDQPSGAVTAAVKGAPQAILDRCTHWLDADGHVAPMTAEIRATVTTANEVMASQGLRVIAIADGQVNDSKGQALVGLTWLGLAGLIDPPAAGVRDTVDQFKRAGIRTVMITGDQALTARAVGADLGVIGPDEHVVTGHTVDAWTDDALAAALPTVGAYSRVTPEAKLRIVAGLQARGEVVAVLGDGVNDAAALKQADVGVAMGRRGTDVARDAADIVLQDDWFPTIGAAIEEGRVIYDNIRKFVFYLFSCNLAEIFVLLVAGAFGSAPLLPIQILWLNLVTDTFPALALAMEPAEPGVMARPPRPAGSALLTRGFLRAITVHAAMLAAVTLVAFVWALRTGNPDNASTVTFMTLALAQLFHLGTARSHDPVLAPARIVANRWALASVALVITLQMLAVTVPVLHTVLHTVPLTAGEWLVIVALAALPASIAQLWRRRRASHREA